MSTARVSVYSLAFSLAFYFFLLAFSSALLLLPFAFLLQFQFSHLCYWFAFITYVLLHICLYFLRHQINIVWIQVIFSNILKIPYVLVNAPEHSQTTCALGYSVLDRLKCLFWCFACAFVLWLIDFFATFINVNKIFFSINGFYVLLIRHTWCLLLDLIIIRTQSIFLSIHFKIVDTCFLSTFIISYKSRLNSFIDVFLVDYVKLNYFVS